MPDNKGGLKIMYHLTHEDGSPADPKGAYFVLKLNSKDPAYARASCLATIIFADAIRRTNKKLAVDLYKLAAKHWEALKVACPTTSATKSGSPTSRRSAPSTRRGSSRQTSGRKP